MLQQQANNRHVTALRGSVKQRRRLVVTQQLRHGSRDFYGVSRDFPGIVCIRFFGGRVFGLQFCEGLLNGRHVSRPARRVQRVVHALI